MGDQDADRSCVRHVNHAAWGVCGVCYVRPSPLSMSHGVHGEEHGLLWHVPHPLHPVPLRSLPHHEWQVHLVRNIWPFHDDRAAHAGMNYAEILEGASGVELQRAATGVKHSCIETRRGIARLRGTMRYVVKIRPGHGVADSDYDRVWLEGEPDDVDTGGGCTECWYNECGKEHRCADHSQQDRANGSGRCSFVVATPQAGPSVRSVVWPVRVRS
jgi:hypothetical protein